MTSSLQISHLQKELSFLYEVARTVTGLEIDEVLKEIVRLASDITSADSVFVYVFEEEKRELILRASKNPHQNLLKKITMKVGEGITGWVAAHQQPVIIERSASCDHRFKFFSSLPEDSFEAFLSVPIINKRGIVGVINVQHKRPHAHKPMEINLLSAMGKLVGGVVENALLVEETMALKEALALRKTLDRAKGVLMKHRHMSEEDAYAFIRSASMKQRKTMKEVADAVILYNTMQR